MPGPALRTDIVEVYAFRRPRPRKLSSGTGASDLAPATAVEFLQLRRVNPPMPGTWQPVMGHVEAGETALKGAMRELAEEAGYTPARGVLAVWQLELVNTYFLASIDAVMLSPGFAVEIAAGVEPVIDASHDAARWVPRDHVGRSFLWPGQRAAIDHIATDLLSPASPIAPLLRVDPSK